MMENEIKPGVWRHYKGKLYRVIGVGKHTETDEDMVLYQALYGDNEYWVRPARMWFDAVPDPEDYHRTTRFQWVREW